MIESVADRIDKRMKELKIKQVDLIKRTFCLIYQTLLLT